jgi:hypothetical protein
MRPSANPEHANYKLQSPGLFRAVVCFHLQRMDQLSPRIAATSPRVPPRAFESHTADVISRQRDDIADTQARVTHEQHHGQGTPALIARSPNLIFHFGEPPGGALKVANFERQSAVVELLGWRSFLSLPGALAIHLHRQREWNPQLHPSALPMPRRSV